MCSSSEDKISKTEASRRARSAAIKALGKPLPEYAIVHHFNNELVLCEDQKYHMLLHMRADAYKACGYAHWRKCNFCGKYGGPAYMYSNNNSAWHRECKNKYDRSSEDKAIALLKDIRERISSFADYTFDADSHLLCLDIVADINNFIKEVENDN